MSGITEVQSLNAAHIGRRVRLVLGDSILVGPLNRIDAWSRGYVTPTPAGIELRIGTLIVNPSPYAAIELLDEDD